MPDSIKLTAENYPISEFYKTDEIITSLGIGEALVTALSEKGNPSPQAATMLKASVSITPQDQMVKVLTNASFIRGVFGILKKVMK